MNAAQEIKYARETVFLYALCRLPSFGAASIKRAGVFFGGYEALLSAGGKAWDACPFLTPKQRGALQTACRDFPALEDELMTLAGRRILFVGHEDPAYPRRLLRTAQPPAGLFVRGRLPDESAPAVAIVGTRGCSAYGEELTAAFAKALSDEGVQIISGLALGIDGAAHRGALRGKTPTWAVLGCGVNICYPSAHYHLFEKILKEGGAVSEFPLDASPRRAYFPMRNRIISGLSDAVLVVEAREKSGALITAEHGLEDGREIFAVPGRPTDPLSAGTNRLIQDGAAMACSPGDILSALGLAREKKLLFCERGPDSLSGREKKVFDCLEPEPKHIDQILVGTELPFSDCSEILMELELAGLVRRCGNQYYGRKF